MKKNNIIIKAVLTLLIIAIVAGSCKEEFLEVAPAGSLRESDLTNLAGLEASLIASYSILLGRAGANGVADAFYSDASNWFWGSVMGADAYKGTNQGDQSQMNEVMAYSVQTTNATVLQRYATLYEGIARANYTLKLASLTADVVAAEDLTRISAEARFLRGYYYFELKKIFNNTPYIDETWDEVELIPNDKDLWPFIEADFQYAFDNLPATQGDVGRANKWAAGAFMGKTYVYQGKYDQAIAMFDDVITQGVTTNGTPYGLVEKYEDLWRASKETNEETVFAAQAAVGTGSVQNANASFVLNFPHGSNGPQRPGGCCGFNQPTFDLVNSFRTDANGLPLLDNSFNNDPVVSDMGLESGDAFAPDAGNLDPRLDHSVGRRGIPYLDWGPHPGFDWIRDQDYGGPYSPKKFIYYKGGDDAKFDASSWTPGYTAVNYSIMRFADVLLLAAEAEIESTSGDLDKALGYINRVRTRAANSPVKLSDGVTDAANYVVNNYTSFASRDEARAAVRFERRLELSGEGHRFYDVVRWGIADQELNRNVSVANSSLVNSPFVGAEFTTGRDEYLPIPQSEIDLLGASTLKQNPGYQ